MFGFLRKTIPTILMPATLISKEKLAAMTEILGTVGLKDPDHYGFQHHVQSRENYSGGVFEWSERGQNMRYYFDAFHNEPIRRATVVVLNGAKNFLYPDEVIAEANRKLEELFKD